MKEQLSRFFGLVERDDSGAPGQEEVRQIPIDLIVSSPYQPRTIFDDERIEELAQTIRTHGMIQPIVVRMTGDAYE